MENESSLRELVFLEIPGNRDYSPIERATAYLKAGRLARDRKNYDLAYHCFGCVAGLHEKTNLKKLFGNGSKYYSLAGDMAKLEGSSYYAQEAGLAYSKAGDRNKLEAHLKDLGYDPSKLSPGSWMEMAMILLEDSRGGQNGK
jgi:hypothetical protein